MVHQRHPDIAEVLVNHLDAGGETPYLSAAVAAARELLGVEHPHGDLKGSWQHEASSRVERQFRGRF